MNSEELRNKCYAFEFKENRKAIFNHNYLSFIINFSFVVMTIILDTENNNEGLQAKFTYAYNLL